MRVDFPEETVMRAPMAFVRRWSFGLVLLLVYLAVFNLWLVVNARWTLVSSIGITVLLVALLLEAARRRYFFNRWEALLHGLVILDILLEGTLLREHHSHGFYLCALGFAGVISAYRLYLGKCGSSASAP